MAPNRYLILTLYIVGVALVIFLLINWSVYKIIGWIIGSAIISAISIALLYYFSLRGLVRAIAFPGISSLFRRNLEY